MSNAGFRKTCRALRLAVLAGALVAGLLFGDHPLASRTGEASLRSRLAALLSTEFAMAISDKGAALPLPEIDQRPPGQIRTALFALG